MGVKWLVCVSLADRCAEPSNLRTCRECDTQVRVPVAMTPLVDSGGLRPICGSCHRESGRLLTLHPMTIQALTRLDRLDEGCRYIAGVNTGYDIDDDDGWAPSALTAAEVDQWQAMRRVSVGRVTLLGDRWLDSGRGVPNYITVALAALRAATLVMLVDSMSGGMPRAVLTGVGDARFEQLCQAVLGMSAARFMAIMSPP